MVIFWLLVMYIFSLHSDINLIFLEVCTLHIAALFLSGIRQCKPARPAYQPKNFHNGLLLQKLSDLAEIWYTIPFHASISPWEISQKYVRYSAVQPDQPKTRLMKKIFNFPNLVFFNHRSMKLVTGVLPEVLNQTISTLLAQSTKIASDRDL